MTTRRRFRSANVALTCTLAMAIPPDLAARVLQAPGPAAPVAARRPAPAQTATPAARTATNEAPEPDGGWPGVYAIDGGGTATWYAPQIASWTDQRQMVAWSAVSYARADLKEPALGTIKIEAETSVAADERLVSFSDFRITESNFPSLPRDQAQALIAGLHKAVPDGDRVIALDRVLTAVDKSTIRPRDVPGIKADPPQIFQSSRPAVLVNLDGDPVWSAIQNVDLKYAVNTNWDLFQAPDETLYLRNERAWLMAKDLKGPWTPAGKLPASFSSLPADENWTDVKANVPGRSLSASAAPTVFVATQPAELLLLNGAPAYQAVSGTALLWVSNTESDLFRLGRSGSFYYLVAGRWFSAPSLDGPWTFATTSLPADFQRIPVDHPRSRVLASVPGTEQATEAVLLAQVPHTARVNVNEVKAPEVSYHGDPDFKPIEGSKISHAVNTDKDVLRVGDLYYMCFQAVWFMSRSPTGPWEVARTVPPEIYAIPPSSPVYHVTYVTVQQSAPADPWVTFAYAAGYTGMMIAWGCAVWGTGWYYPPYVWYGGLYPGYYWYPRTYGFSAWYNPWTGAYGRGAAVYGPFGGAGAAAVYNPRTGTYARGAAAYGPYGGRAAAQAWNPRTGTYGQTRQGGNIYGNWGSSFVQRGDEWARSSHVTNYATGATTRSIRGDDGAGAVTRRGAAGRTTVARGQDGDIYAGHDGSVYRRGDDGTWQHWSDGGWNNTSRPGQSRVGQGGAGTRELPEASGLQLDRDRAARIQGGERTRDWSSYRRAPSMPRAGSFRGGGRRR